MIFYSRLISFAVEHFIANLDASLIPFSVVFSFVFTRFCSYISSITWWCALFFLVLFLNQFQIAIVFAFVSSSHYSFRFNTSHRCLFPSLYRVIYFHVFVTSFFYFSCFALVISFCYVAVISPIYSSSFVSVRARAIHLAWHLSFSISTVCWYMCNMMWWDVCVCRFYTSLFWFDSFHSLPAIYISANRMHSHIYNCGLFHSNAMKMLGECVHSCVLCTNVFILCTINFYNNQSNMYGSHLQNERERKRNGERESIHTHQRLSMT